MSREPERSLNFADTASVLASAEVWEYDFCKLPRIEDVTQQTLLALQSPIDFPPMEAAVVSGDHVAVAVDPNIPGLIDVLRGVIEALRQTEAGDVEVVLADEVSAATLARIRDELPHSVHIACHETSDRGALRYLAADADANPIYLNRRLVDADFVLPVVAARPLHTHGVDDVTGIYPTFADSTSRHRHRVMDLSPVSTKQHTTFGDAEEPAWLLGVQLMISVVASEDGGVAQLVAGTPDAVRARMSETHSSSLLQRAPDDVPPSAQLVVATLDGGEQQQTWRNAARAVAAASRYCQPDGTIVLWSDIEEAPSDRMANLKDGVDASIDEPVVAEEDFPPWDESTCSAQSLGRVAVEYRVLIHSRLDQEAIEAMGLAAIDSADELARLSQSFESCGVLRAAQYWE